MCAPRVPTYSEYNDWLAVMNSRLRLAPPKQTLAQVSGNVSVFFQEAKLPVARDVAPHEVSPLPAPGRPLGPFRPHVIPMDCCVEQLVFGEALVQDHDIRIGIAHRLIVWPVALRLRQGGNTDGKGQE
jgi:hypothetical protein